MDLRCLRKPVIIAFGSERVKPLKCLVDFFALILWPGAFLNLWAVCFITIFNKTFYINANSADLDQTLRSTASDLGLNCLPVSLL